MFGRKAPQEVRQVYIASPSGGFMTRTPTHTDSPGCSLCGICRCCTCISLGFFATPTGVVKIIEFIFGVICQMLLLQYGMEYTEKLGIGYSVFLTVNSGSVLTTGVLLLCYVTSTATYTRVRPSLFEVIFTAVSCGLYLGASTFLATSVYKHLFYYYHTIPGFSAYPALTAVYVLGYAAGIVHGVDSVMALKFMRTVR